MFPSNPHDSIKRYPPSSHTNHRQQQSNTPCTKHLLWYTFALLLTTLCMLTPQELHAQDKLARMKANYKKGYEAFLKKRYRRASQLLYRAYKMAPQTPRFAQFRSALSFFLGVSFAKRQREAQARTWLQRFLRSGLSRKRRKWRTQALALLKKTQRYTALKRQKNKNARNKKPKRKRPTQTRSPNIAHKRKPLERIAQFSPKQNPSHKITTHVSQSTQKPSSKTKKQPPNPSPPPQFATTQPPPIPHRRLEIRTPIKPKRPPLFTIAGLSAVSLGVITLGTGIVLTISAVGHQNTANQLYNQGIQSSEDTATIQSALQTARSSSGAGFALLGFSVLSLGIGTLLLLAKPSQPSSNSVTPQAVPSNSITPQTTPATNTQTLFQPNSDF
ncbi:MAG: tetratricopeptide repeat protein [Myxococcota bacterium]